MNRPRILVVDDDPAMLHSVARILGADYEVHADGRSATAVELARRHSPQLAIVDVRMPELDGFQVMARLKQLNPHIQVILMTGSVYDIDEQLVRAIRERAFYYIQKPFDRGVLLALVQRALELERLAHANRTHLAHLQNQLEEARAFQQTMLPPSHGAIETFRVAASLRPCTELGGDFYDYAHAGPGTAALVIADVVGHGASAAMMTALVKSAFHAAHAEGYDPAAVVRRVAQAVAGLASDRFVTLLSARVCAPTGTLEFVNAGHHGGALYVRGDLAGELPSGGPIVSPALPRARWEKRSLPWRKDSLLLLYTDGIPEAGHEDEPFGTARIHEVVAGCGGRPEQVIPCLLAAIDGFGRQAQAADDQTLMVAWETLRASAP